MSNGASVNVPLPLTSPRVMRAIAEARRQSARVTTLLLVAGACDMGRVSAGVSANNRVQYLPSTAGYIRLEGAGRDALKEQLKTSPVVCHFEASALGAEAVATGSNTWRDLGLTWRVCVNVRRWTCSS